MPSPHAVHSGSPDQAPGDHPHRPRPGRPYNPYDLLGQADDLHAQVSGLHAALEHHERLATLGTIAGLIAHEFNNILTPVMSYAQMALARPGDRELAAKALTKAVEGTERAAAISAAILGFVRDDTLDMRTGRGRHDPRPDVPRGTSGENAAPHAPAGPSRLRCSLRSVIDDALTCLAREPQKDGIQLRIEGDPALAAATRGLSLQHVVLNLILNARNAMVPGGGVLSLTTRRADAPPPLPAGAASSLEPDDLLGRALPTPDASADLPFSGPCVILEIADTGRGMSPEQLARLFHPFYTTGITPSRHDPDHSPNADRPADRRRGTGLGMTICKRLIAECGGYLFVSSTPGRGTVCTIVLPEAAPDASAARTAA